MRTVEEFTKVVEEENKYFNQCILRLKKPIYVIPHAYEIAKWQAIYDYIEGKVIPYLESGENEFEEFLMLEISNPITAIYEYEANYSEPQWTSWDNLDDVVCGMFRIIKKHN